MALGKLRRVSGDYEGKLLLIDPHRAPSFTQRHVRKRTKERGSRPTKVAQTFFCIDGDSREPLCFTTATSAQTVSQATPGLLGMTADILVPSSARPLVAADAEHFTAELFDHVRKQSSFDLIVPLPNRPYDQRRWRNIPAADFTPHWAGYATAILPFTPHNSRNGACFELVQRLGERPEDYEFRSFLSTTKRDHLEALTSQYPKRWHIEEFFNFNQSLGWRRAGTLNLNIRYGQMTMALIAQAVIHRLRKRLGDPFDGWDAKHLASGVFRGLSGDVRVRGDTIVVTYYDASDLQRLRPQYENLPAKLAAEGVNPRIPWLYDLKLDFQFK